MDALRRAESADPEQPAPGSGAAESAPADSAALELEPVPTPAPPTAGSSPGEQARETTTDTPASPQPEPQPAIARPAVRPARSGRLAYFLAGFTVVIVAVGGYYLYRLEQLNDPARSRAGVLVDRPQALPALAAAPLDMARPAAAPLEQHAAEQNAPPARPAKRLTNGGDAADPATTAVSPVPAATVPAASSDKPSTRIEIHRSRRVRSVHPLVRKAYRAYGRQDYATAERLYRRALQRHPRNRDALLGLGAIALHKGNRRVARYYYEQVLKINPADKAALLALQSIDGSGDRLQEGSRIKHWLQSDGDNAQLHFALGNRYAAAGQWKEAQEAYFKAFTIGGDNPDYAFNLAVSLDQLNLRTQALDYYRKAVRLAAEHGAEFSLAAAKRRIVQLQKHGETGS